MTDPTPTTGPAPQRTHAPQVRRMSRAETVGRYVLLLAGVAMYAMIFALATADWLAWALNLPR